MSDHIDTSPAALRELADMFDGNYPREVIDALRAVAAEKEAQTKQEPFAWATKSGIARFAESGVGALTAYKKHCIPAKEGQSAPLYLDPQPAAEKESNKCPRQSGKCWAEFFDGRGDEQHHIADASNMVAPADMPLSPAEHQVLREAVRDSVEVVHEGFVLADMPLPEPTLHEIQNQRTGERHLSDHGVAYYGSNWRLVRSVYTNAEMLAHREAYANAKVAAERERCAARLEAMARSDSADGLPQNIMVVSALTMAAYQLRLEALRVNQKGTV